MYDGDSVLAPLLAVFRYGTIKFMSIFINTCYINICLPLFSGLTTFGGYQVQKLNEVTSTSSSVLLYFYSDLAYNMSGFNISYRFFFYYIFYYLRIN